MRRISLISGCFDGLHKGHRYILAEARKLTGYLVVCLNHDAYLTRKGPGRPMHPLEERRAQLYAAGVDEVIEIADSPLEVIMALKPDYICVGRADYAPEEVVGYDECTAWAGRVTVISKDLGVSTTQLVNKRFK